MKLRSMFRSASALLLICGIALVLGATPGEATHDLYAYKMPCVPGDACYVTNLAHPTNAFDFDPLGSAGRGNIINVSQGSFSGYVTQSSECTWPDDHGLGMYAVVSDVHGRTMTYAHLSSFGNLSVGSTVVQGDKIGVEGNTGYAASCQDHLHLEGIATVAGIDGTAISDFVCCSTSYASTNSLIGGGILLGAGAVRIRERYVALGGWGNVGWTHAIAPGSGDCASSTLPYCTVGCGVPHCRLNVHYYPNVNVGHWGSIQTFRLHPDAAGHENVALTWHRWSGANIAFRVNRDTGFFAAWVNGGQNPLAPGPYHDMGLPIEVRTGSYQRFHVGYIKIFFPYTAARFCPDVAGGLTPGPGDYNGTVSGPDFFTVLAHFGEEDLGLQPYQAWSTSWYDINGDGGVAAEDFFDVLGAFGLDCTSAAP